MMDEHQSPSSNKKRKSAVALPSQKRCLIKKTKIPGNLAGTCALSQSPSKTSFISSSTSSNQTTRIPAAKNAKASPATSSNPVSHSRDLTSPTRVSSRVSRPTFKKKALSAKKPCLPESDGTPPLSIILPIPSPSLKQKKPKSSPTKRPAGNNTPSKRKWLDPDPIEITSSDDDSRPQPPRKRIKHTHKKPFSSEVIDLCTTESEDVIASPRHTCTQDEESVVFSTDEEVDLEFPALSHLAFKKIDTRKCPALPPLRDISPPIEIESSQASSPPLSHNTPVSKPKALVSKDGVTDGNLPRGSLQVLYNEALTRCTREPRRDKDISDQPSPFSSLKCVPPARIIRYATQTQSPSLHTPLFFSRIILRLRARVKQPKTLDAKAFSDARASFSNPKALPDATTFSAISNDTDLNSMEVSNFTEDQDTLTYPDAIMERSAVDSEALEIATEAILMPPIDFQDETSSNMQVDSISPSVVYNIDVDEKLVSRLLGSPSPLPFQESPSREVTILEDTPILHSIQAPTTICDQVASIEPIVLKNAQSFLQELQQIYDVPEIYEFSVPPALELNDTAKASAAFESITSIAFVAISSSPSLHTSESSASRNLLELSMEQETTLNVSSSAGPSSRDVSCGLECLSEFPTIPNLYPLSSSSSTDTLSSHASESSLSTGSLQSLDSSATSESVACHLLTPNDSPSPLTPLVKAQKQESLICSKTFPSPIGVSFGTDMSELNLQTIMCNMFDDDDDISISGMELAYPEESQTI